MEARKHDMEQSDLIPYFLVLSNLNFKKKLNNKTSCIQNNLIHHNIDSFSYVHPKFTQDFC